MSLVDTINGGYGEEPLDLPSSLPGLRRSAYLASQTQLDNLVGQVAILSHSVVDHAQTKVW